MNNVSMAVDHVQQVVKKKKKVSSLNFDIYNCTVRNGNSCFNEFLRYLDIDVPDRVMERRLLGLVRDLEKEREEYINQEALVKKQTDILAAQFRNNATQSVAFSEAQAQLQREQAKADALKRVEKARINGLASMCSALGVRGKQTYQFTSIFTNIERLERECEILN